MNQITTYQTLKSPIQAEFKDKGSRFLAFAYPVQTAEQVKKRVDDLRQEHYKARHWCYAYRLGVDGNQFRANDDGEPSGSAGRPILGQIYAYKTSTQMALENAQIIERNIEKTVRIRCEYPYLNEAIRIAKNHQVEIIEQDLQLDCRLTVRIPLANAEACLAAWAQTRQIELLEVV